MLSTGKGSRSFLVVLLGMAPIAAMYILAVLL